LRGSITDIARWTAANIDVETTPFPDALRLAQRVHDEESGTCLSWVYEDDVLWHNGGTGGFHSFCGFNSQRRFGVAVLGNRGSDEVTDVAAQRLIKELKES
jgi:CubicO group peptidase (beta-lactamase class C family)